MNPPRGGDTRLQKSKLGAPKYGIVSWGNFWSKEPSKDWSIVYLMFTCSHRPVNEGIGTTFRTESGATAVAVIAEVAGTESATAPRTNRPPADTASACAAVLIARTQQTAPKRMMLPASTDLRGC